MTTWLGGENTLATQTVAEELSRWGSNRIVKLTPKGISKMIEGTGGRLVQSGRRLLNVLERHPNPEALVERRTSALRFAAFCGADS